MVLFLPSYLFNARAVCFMITLFSLFIDSLIAFKAGMLLSVGMFTMGFLNMYFKDARPFWKETDIYCYDHCLFTFGSPDYDSFAAVFLYGYFLIMYRYKYKARNYEHSGSGKNGQSSPCGKCG